MCWWVNPTHWPQLPTGHNDVKKKTRNASPTTPLLPSHEISKGVFPDRNTARLGKIKWSKYSRVPWRWIVRLDQVFLVKKVGTWGAVDLRISPPIFLRYDTTIIFPKQLKFFSSDVSKHILPSVKPLHFNLPKDAPERKFDLCETYAAVHLNQVIAVGMLRKHPCHYFSKFCHHHGCFLWCFSSFFRRKKCRKEKTQVAQKWLRDRSWTVAQMKFGLKGEPNFSRNCPKANG